MKMKRSFHQLLASSFLLSTLLLQKSSAFIYPSLSAVRFRNMSSETQETPTSLSANELIEIVDENNNVLEPTYRHIMRKNKLIHRATYAFIKTSNNYFYVQKRSTLKDYCPGYFDPTPGGVVAAGESYALTNMREIEEEMGIKDTPCTHLFTFYYEDERIKCFGDAWETIYNGPLCLQRAEVESIHMMSMTEILERFEAGEKFTPDSLYACKEYVRLNGLPEPDGPAPIIEAKFDDE